MRNTRSSRNTTSRSRCNPTSFSLPTSSEENINMVGQLQQLADLKAAGALTDKEFVAAKTKLLQG